MLVKENTPFTVMNPASDPMIHATKVSTFTCGSVSSSRSSYPPRRA
jgi:hypothetical protein